MEKELQEVYYCAPSLNEQQKIADILSARDRTNRCILQFNEHEILQNAGKVRREVADRLEISV